MNEARIIFFGLLCKDGIGFKRYSIDNQPSTGLQTCPAVVEQIGMGKTATNKYCIGAFKAIQTERRFSSYERETDNSKVIGIF